MTRYLFFTLLSSLIAFPSLSATSLSSEQCLAMKKAHVISEQAPLPCSRLKQVDVTFRDFSGKTQTGAIIVMDAVAHRVEMIFSALYQHQIPIQSITPIREFFGDDEASMRANNTSAFNARPMTGGSSWSKHAYGLAIDINPLQNPFVEFQASQIVVKPPQAAKHYLNRYSYRLGKPFRTGMAEEMVDIFANNGFLIWGGYWNDPIDYQHFEIGPRALVNRLTAEPSKARGVFEKYIADYLSCMQLSKQTPRENARAHCAASVVEKYSHWPAQ